MSSTDHHFKTENGVLNKYEGPRGDVVILAGVTLIGAYAFYDRWDVTAVVICSGVTSISHYAFYGCTRLTAVVIPEGVKSLGSYVFGACTELTEITLPASLASIGVLAFYDCSALQKIWVDGTDADVERIRGLLPQELRGKVLPFSASVDRRNWLVAACAPVVGVAVAVAVANPVVPEGDAAGAGGAVGERPNPLLATVLSDAVRVCIPPAAVGVDAAEAEAEVTSHRVLSEYAGMVALFL